MRQQSILFTSLFVLALIPATSFALSEMVPQVERATDVVEKWSPNTHLFVKGNVGVANHRLLELSNWIEQEAPHWTVVLVDDADSETYLAADGVFFRGMDAVEVALGRGLSNRTNFGDLEHPKTGEQDGAIFVLFLKERKLSYFSSDAQDRRNLGRSHWIGELDRPAIRAMRNGGRVVDAVKDTISQIDERLARAIEREQADERRRQRDVIDARSALEDLQHSIEQVIGETSELRQANPEATGAMLAAPTDAWTSRLETLRNELTEETLRENSRQRIELATEVSRYLNWLASYETFEDTVAALQERITAAEQFPNDVAAKNVAEAKRSIASAEEAHRQADPSFAEHLQAVDAELGRAEQLGAAELTRLEKLAARRRLIRNTVLVTLGLAALLATGLLIYFNRRRAPVRDAAVKAIEEREKSVRTEMDVVSQLITRSSEILGSRERVEKRGYEGATREMCDETFDTVDELLVMSNEVDRVMDEARDLVYPKDLIGKVVNKFSVSRFERGMSRISGEPLTFHENQGIPAILCPPDLETPPETLSLTFEAVFDAFHQRTGNTTDALQLLEDCMVEVNDQLKSLQDKIDAATRREKELDELADEDDFFPVPNFFEQLLPSAQADHDAADDRAGVDPVKAVREQIPTGIRKIDEAMKIADAIAAARSDVFPTCDKFAPRLKALEYSTDWIGTRAEALGEVANQLFLEATERSVADGIEKLRENILRIADDAEQCAELAEDLRNVHSPAIETLATSVVDARDEICRKLNLSPEKSLHEKNTDPDVRIASAREQLSATQAAIHHGDTTAATLASETLCDEVTMGHEIVTKTLEVLRTFDNDLRERKNELERSQSNYPRIDDTVDTIKERFSESAQRLQAGDPSCPDEFATVETRQVEARNLLAEAEHFVDTSLATYQDGRLLEAATMLQAAEGQIEHVNVLMDEIMEHSDRLDAQLQQNANRLQQLKNDVESLRREVDDHRTTKSTVDSYQDLIELSRAAAEEVEQTSAQVDPFRVATNLEHVNAEIRQLKTRVTADQNSFEEASRAVQGAVDQLAIGLRHVDQAEQDAIPDSSMTRRLIHGIRDSERTIDSIRARLKVPHEDWQTVDDQAARITGELGRQSAGLKGELQLAQRATMALETASREVFSATRWTGGFGVNVGGSPGASELDRARRALQSGNYQSILELSRAATIAAQYAVQRAQREVERRRREQQRRAEEARRREAARRRQMNRPTISFGSGSSASSSRPSINVGSPSRSVGSPSRSNNSGFSRSGW